MDLLADLHRVQRKLDHLSRKYGCGLEQFEARVNAEDESFDQYDDLIEWKAYAATKADLEARIEELKHGRFQVA